MKLTWKKVEQLFYKKIKLTAKEFYNLMQLPTNDFCLEFKYSTGTRKFRVTISNQFALKYGY